MFALTFGLLIPSGAASAHVRSTTGYSTVTQAGDAIEYRLELEYELIAKALDIGVGTLRGQDDTQRNAPRRHRR